MHNPRLEWPEGGGVAEQRPALGSGLCGTRGQRVRRPSSQGPRARALEGPAAGAEACGDGGPRHRDHLTVSVVGPVEPGGLWPRESRWEGLGGRAAAWERWGAGRLDEVGVGVCVLWGCQPGGVGGVCWCE